MTVTTTAPRPAPERIAVRCVDSDVHPATSRGTHQYIPSRGAASTSCHRVGEQIYYDAPDYAHSYAMRVDTFPADGEFPAATRNWRSSS